MIEGVLGIVLLAGGVALIAHVLTRALTLQRMRAWPVVPGQVICSRVLPVRRQGRGRRRWRHQLVFDYRVGAHLHRGARRRLHESRTEVLGFLSRRQAEAALKRLPPGSMVWVRHDPAEPKRAVLEMVDDEAGAHALAGLAFSTLGFLVMLGVV